MDEEIGVKELRDRLADVLNGVAVHREVKYVTSRGRRIAVLRPLDDATPPVAAEPRQPKAEMPADLWERFKAVAKPDHSSVLAQFVSWYLYKRGAKLPERPPRGSG
jgi:antitoxin (DNA-binding transcriptional repressor) of toxin-antitoxin stability system